MKRAPEPAPVRGLAGLLLLVAVIIAACGGAPPEPTHEPTIAAPPADGRLPPDVRPLRYRLDFALDPKKSVYDGTVEIDLQLDRRRDVLWLHGRRLALWRPTLRLGDGTTLSGRVRDVGGQGLFAVFLPEPVGPARATLRIEFGGIAQKGCNALYRHERGGDAYLFTQLEPTFARELFPSFDEPGFKTPFDISVLAPAEHTVVSNAPVASVTPLGDRKRTVFATTAPLPTYLLALAVGPFDVVTAAPVAPSALRSRAVPLRGAAYRGRGQEMRWALEEARHSLADLEAALGSAYPFDKLDFIAVPCGNPVAMEQPGAVTLQDRLAFADPARTIPADVRLSAATIAHELAHMWFGNSVTPRWWGDLWLNESFATWLESAVMQRRRPADRADVLLATQALRAMRLDSLAATRAIQSEVRSEAQIKDSFDDVNYSKGGAVLAMIERWAGPARLSRALRDYLAAHRGGSASAEDLLRAVASGTSEDAAAALRTFLVQPGVPWIEARLDCTGKEPLLRLRQARYLPLGSEAARDRLWQVPVCVRYPDGVKSSERCTLLRGAEGALALPAGRCPAWVMPNAAGSGYYRWQLPARELASLGAVASSLGVRERISFVDAVHAGWGRGALPAGDALQLLAPLARDGEPEIAAGAMSPLNQARAWLIDDPALRAKVERYARDIYGPVHAALGPQERARESPEESDLRGRVREFLVWTGRDAALRAQIAAPARAHLGGASKDARPEELALRLAVADGGAPLFDTALARLASARGGDRMRYLRGLASATEADLAKRARDLALDERVQPGEVVPYLLAIMDTPELREPAWAWIGANAGGLVGRVSADHRAWLPQLGARLCDARSVEELRARFGAVAAETAAGKARLEASVEGIRICAAQRGALIEGVRGFFASRK